MIVFEGREYKLVGHYASWPNLRTSSGKPASGWVVEPAEKPPRYSYKSWKEIEIADLVGALARPGVKAYFKSPWILVVVASSSHQDRYYYREVIKEVRRNVSAPQDARKRL